MAFALRGPLVAAFGDVATHVLEALFADESQAADFAAEKDLLGEALALQTLRRARAGKALFQAGDMVSCTERLWAVLRFAATKSGGRLDAVTLHGVPERVPRTGEYRWQRPSLLHALLLASGLRFEGEGVDGDQPRQMPAAKPTPPASSLATGDPVAYAAAFRVYEEDTLRVALAEAVAEGSVTSFVKALDDVLASPDELELLSAWAVLHLWRPF